MKTEFDVNLKREELLYLIELVNRDKRKGTDFNPYIWRYEREKVRKKLNAILNYERNLLH
jgi:hypothetical protein